MSRSTRLGERFPPEPKPGKAPKLRLLGCVAGRFVDHSEVKALPKKTRRNLRGTWK